MSIQDKTDIKAKFENGDIPDHQDFVDLIDSVNVPLVLDVGNASSNVSTDVTTGDIFELNIMDNINLDKPTNAINGKTVTWLMTQSNGGTHIITTDPSFIVPESATLPLEWSTTEGLTDIFVAKYHSGSDKWLVMSMIPGYSI